MNCLERAKSELRHGNPEESDLQKAIFIRFALHVVGDTHQPLHSTVLINETYPTAGGDFAGNVQKISNFYINNIIFFNKINLI